MALWPAFAATRLFREAVPMWDEQKRIRFQQLREHQENCTLTEAEQPELASLVRDLEAGEAAYLQPATERLRQGRMDVEATNRRLEIVADRQQALAVRLSSRIEFE